MTGDWILRQSRLVSPSVFKSLAARIRSRRVKWAAGMSRGRKSGSQDATNTASSLWGATTWRALHRGSVSGVAALLSTPGAGTAARSVGAAVRRALTGLSAGVERRRISNASWWSVGRS